MEKNEELEITDQNFATHRPIIKDFIKNKETLKKRTLTFLKKIIKMSENFELKDSDIYKYTTYKNIPLEQQIMEMFGKNLHNFNQREKIEEIKNTFLNKNRKNFPNMYENIYEIIREELIISNAASRASDKSMTTNSSNAHVTNRGKHMQEVGVISKRIAEDLGLNSKLVQIIGEAHDLGHTFNGHSGERILDGIATYNNCGYEKHNAIAAYILERENTFNKAKRRIEHAYKDISSKTLEEAEDFFSYMIDGIVAHNGEGTDAIIKFKKDKTKQQMQEEIEGCFTEEDYDKKIIPATLEGAVIRYADIIAYVSSDILDAFRLKKGKGDGKKILESFDDEYLKIIGTLIAKENENVEFLNKEHQLLLKEYKNEIKIDSLKRNLEMLDNYKENNVDKRLEETQKIYKENLEKSLKEQEIIQEELTEFNKIKIEYAKLYINYLPKEERNKESICQMMQEVFVKDLIEASQGKEYITMSPLIRRTFFELRSLNGEKIIPYTRKKFDMEVLPSRINSLVELLAENLINTGFVIKNVIPEEEKPFKPCPEDNKKYKETISELHQNAEKKQCERKIYHYYTNLFEKNPNLIKQRYKEVKKANKDITKREVEFALKLKEYDEKIADARIKQRIDEEEKLTTEKNRIIDKKFNQKNNFKSYETDKLLPIYGTMKDQELFPKGFDSNSESDIEKVVQKIVDKKINDKKNGIETMLAKKLVLEYIGSISDSTIKNILIERGLLSQAEVISLNDRIERDEERDKSQKDLTAKWKNKNARTILSDDELLNKNLESGIINIIDAEREGI